MNLVQLAFSDSVNKLTKLHEDYLRYKLACVKNYINCDKLLKNKTFDNFAECQVKCQYSYDYQIP